MARKISTGVTGGPILGVLRTVNSTLTPNTTNENLVLEPTGTGIVIADSHVRIENNNQVRFTDGDSNYVGLKGPASVAADITLELPSTTGASGQVITTNGSGVLDFSDVSIPVTNNTVSGTTHYPMLTTSTSGGVTDIVTSSSGISFIPSTGTLTVTNATVNGTLTASTINETSSITLKENISPLQDSLEKIQSLVPVTYIRKETGAVESGLIAEQVAEILPEIVATDEDGNPQTVAYSRLTAYLIGAVKALSDQVNSMKRI